MTDAQPVSTQPEKATGVPVPAQGRKALMLRSAEFRKEREQSWQRLDALLVRLEKEGVASLTPEAVEQLPLLYRATISSLSVARTIVLDRNLLLYLENLSLRAYLAIYGPRTGMQENLREFLLTGFPRAVRAMRLHLLFATLLFLVGVVAGYALVANDMSAFSLLVPEFLAGSRGPGSSTEALRQAIFADWPGAVETFVVFANSLFRHNTIVGILCFGLGFALGVPTMLLLLYNGLILGAFVALYASRALAVDFIGWLSIHGVTEILAILLCGAAGLVVAEKIIIPGRFSRPESIARYGRRAASVAAGCVLLFFIAGILEGGFRQLVANTVGRYAFALGTAALWLAYFALCGKGERHDPAR